MKKNVLITGVAGMIGSHLIDELLKKKKYSVTGIDNLIYGKENNVAHNFGNPDFKFYKVDVLDTETLKILGKDIDVIVHLAAVKKIAEKDSSIPTLTINNKGTENILETAKMWGAKVIFASTSDVYGMSDDLPFKENGDLLLGPSMIKRWSYAVSKLYCEQLAFAYHTDYNVPVVVLRYFGGFSPRSSFLWVGGHIPIFIHSVLNNEELLIHGDGKQTRSMAYIDDIINGTILAMENNKAVGEIINIGNDEEMSVIDTAYLIHKIANTEKKIKIKYIPMKEVFGDYKDIMRRIPDLTKAKKILGYTPKYNFRDSVKKCIELIRNDNKIK